MLPDRVSNPGPLTYESSALPIALRGPAVFEVRYLENDNGDPPFFLLHFLTEGVKIYNIGKYE